MNKDSAPLPSLDRLRVLPLDLELAARIRSRRVDDFGGCVESRSDPDRHQCRVCLRMTEPYEEYLLFSHSPFVQRTPYSERGPIFIHARDCEPYTETDEFPEEFPRDIVLRAYDTAGSIVEAELSRGDDLEQLASAILARPGVSFVHARNRTYGCFMFQFEAASRGSGHSS